jgi:DNA replication protein DnaC
MYSSFIVDKSCITCKKIYQTTIYKLLGGELDLSVGKCESCRRESVKEELGKNTKVVVEQRERWRRDCGITPRFAKCCFDNYKTDGNKILKSINTDCKNYAENFPLNYYQYIKNNKQYNSLVLASPVNGIGKTHLAFAIINRILDRWNGENVVCPVKFITEPEIYAQIKATFSYSDEERNTKPSEEDIIKSLIFTPLLVIDDIGKTPQNDMKFIQRTLYRVIDGRYQRLFPVVLTTNLTPKGLENYLGTNSDKAIINRLIEMVNGKFIELVGESYRIKV